MKFVQAQSEFGELVTMITSPETLVIGFMAFWVVKLFAT